MKKKITLTETDLIKLIKKVITEKTKGPAPAQLGPRDTESAAKAKPRRQSRPPQPPTTGKVTQSMIVSCRDILQGVPGTTATWRQNFKQTVRHKPCNWVMNRYQYFANKAQTVPTNSSAYKRYMAKSGFLECLVGLCN